ncbi:hypothetical protein VNO78_20350 [Psophocarpus tetragonolobus]|uniref:WIYLD domain-containing protein n=1 Tax=Psophocarpus tetragonolobus TaxID=3891 RepID=A0AAN9XH46_PSOTE
MPVTLSDCKTHPLVFSLSFPMAPNRRSAKKGETRMDAALDAMLPFGFSNRLVRSTVNSLLKVYGGNKGWVFIEDSSYSLLIETLLADPSASPQDGLIETNPGDSAEVTPAGCSNSASNSVNVVDSVSTTSEIGNALPIQSVTHANQLLIEAAIETRKAATISISAEKESECQPAGNSDLGENHEPKSPQLLTTLCRKKRRPCYGWISNDDEEDEELIQLPADSSSISCVERECI